MKSAVIVFFLMSAVISGLSGAGPEIKASDDLAKEKILEINSNYEPWFKPVWEPSQENENLLFTLQAAAGAGIIGYFLGYLSGRKSRKNKK